jgi:WYL domain
MRVSTDHKWYLVAFDLDRDDWRIFRADRLREPRQPVAQQCVICVPGDWVVDRLHVYNPAELIEYLRARGARSSELHGIAALRPAVSSPLVSLSPTDKARKSA